MKGSDELQISTGNIFKELPDKISFSLKMLNISDLTLPQELFNPETLLPEANLFDLAGKVSLVTGAGSGLGRVFCEAMAEHGFEAKALALALDGLCLVVTPLISLMEDQVRRALEVGLRAAHLSAGQGRDERKATAERARTGQLDLLFVVFRLTRGTAHSLDGLARGGGQGGKPERPPDHQNDE